MGIDLEMKGRIQSRYGRKATCTNNYQQLLIKLYKFLARRTDAKFNEIVHKRLCQSRISRYPLSISKLVKHADNEDKKNKILVVVGKVLNDERLLEMPKLRVCALQFSETARRKIIKAGGECLTFNELVKVSPDGKNTVLLRGRRSREALKHFGPPPGTPGSHTKPYVLNANHKSKERQYGHRSK